MMTSVSREKASFDPLFNPGALAASQDDVVVVPQPTPSPPSVTMTLDEFLDDSSTQSKSKSKQPAAPQKPKSLFGDDDIEDDFTVKRVAITYRDNLSTETASAITTTATVTTTTEKSVRLETDPLRAPVSSQPQSPKSAQAAAPAEVAKVEKQEEKKEAPVEQDKPVEEEEVIDFGAKNEEDGEDLIANVGNLKISAQAKRPVLFDDEDESDIPRNDLTGVFMPSESIEKRVQITADATDKSLLDIDSEDALSRFISPTSSSSSSSSAILSSAPSQAKASTTATKEEDLDEDLFSFGGPSKSSTGAAAFGGDINQFDFHAYISQAQSKDDDDDLFA